MSTTVNIPTVDVIGTTTNNNAAAGEIGEYIESAVIQSSAISLTSGAAANITSISLTAGDWDVNAGAAFVVAATTTPNRVIAFISEISADPNFNPGRFAELSFAGIALGACQPAPSIAPYRFSLASTTTLYLVVFATFGVSTIDSYGLLRARRVR